MSESHDNLIEYFRLRVIEDEDGGLGEWEGAISAYRDGFLLEDSQRLLTAAKSWPLSPSGRARVREEEALLLFQGNEWPQAQRRFTGLLKTYRQLGDRHGEARTLGHLGMLADLQGDADDAETLFRQTEAIFVALG